MGLGNAHGVFSFIETANSVIEDLQGYTITGPPDRFFRAFACRIRTRLTEHFGGRTIPDAGLQIPEMIACFSFVGYADGVAVAKQVLYLHSDYQLVCPYIFGDTHRIIFFLGGHDLEMAEVARILRERGIPFVDRGLDWADAVFSAYDPEVRAAIRDGERPILVELRDVPQDVLPFADVIDHHGPESGHLPTSLEQVLARLGVTALTREQQLIAANDKGYIEGMAAIGATTEEIRRIRMMDRQAQGITAEQEAAATAAIVNRDETTGGLTIVVLPHGKTATVTDRLSAIAGGPGYKNLLVESPLKLSFFGEGRLILELVNRFGGYCGGDLPHKGYWGIEASVGEARSSIKKFIRHSLADGTLT